MEEPARLGVAAVPVLPGGGGHVCQPIPTGPGAQGGGGDQRGGARAAGAGVHVRHRRLQAAGGALRFQVLQHLHQRTRRHSDAGPGEHVAVGRQLVLPAASAVLRGLPHITSPHIEPSLVGHGGVRGAVRGRHSAAAGGAAFCRSGRRRARRGAGLGVGGRGWGGGTRHRGIRAHLLRGQERLPRGDGGVWQHPAHHGVAAGGRVLRGAPVPARSVWSSSHTYRNLCDGGHRGRGETCARRRCAACSDAMLLGHVRHCVLRRWILLAGKSRNTDDNKPSGCGKVDGDMDSLVGNCILSSGYGGWQLVDLGRSVAMVEICCLIKVMR
mmetsp:Transcript_16659/g.32189  ORF Transcript_16659/g.32189 Transcript_16659/m.32189 type:complete len:326 (-) Transcript_16659:300-1277(-)